MKKSKIFVIAMFILNIVSINTMFAQRGPTGTGFFRPEFEYQTDPIAIKDHFKVAMIKAFGIGDLECFERTANQTRNVSPQIVFRTISDHLKGNGSLTGSQVASMLRSNQVEFITVGPEYWDTRENAYFTANGGLGWWDPRTSSLFKDRREWIIARFYINGEVKEIVANCGNIVRNKFNDTNNGLETFTPNNTVTAAPATNAATSIIYIQPSPYQQVDEFAMQKNTKRSWLKRNAGWLIPAAIVVGGVAGYLLSKGGAKGGSNTYDNNFPHQGGSGPSGVPNTGGGSPQTW